DASGLGALGDELADLLRLRGLVALEYAQIGFHRRGRRERTALEVVDDLSDDVLAGAGHDQARTLGRTVELLAPTDLTAQARSLTRAGVLVVVDRNGHGHLPAFPALRRTRSPA